MQIVFSTTLNQMLGFFVMMLLGFLGNQKQILGEGTDTILSKLLSNLIAPALAFQTFARNFKVDIMREKTVYILAGVAVLAVSVLISWILTRFFAKERYAKNIYFYSFTIANLGYMGYSVAGAVFGEETLFNMMVFCIPFQVFIYSIGLSILNPDNSKISFKSLLNPVFAFMVLGALVGLLNVPIPSAIENTVSSIFACMAPSAMLLTGYVIGKYNVKKMLLNGKIFLASLLRLLMIPGSIAFVMTVLGVQQELVRVTLCTLAMPMGLNTVVFPAAYGAETKTGASMALISNLLGVVTIPLMFVIFIG